MPDMLVVSDYDLNNLEILSYSFVSDPRGRENLKSDTHTYPELLGGPQQTKPSKPAAGERQDFRIRAPAQDRDSPELQRGDSYV